MIHIVVDFYHCRFESFAKMFQSWRAPGVAVFYGTDAQVMQLQTKISRNEHLRHRKNLVYHIVYKRHVRNTRGTRRGSIWTITVKKSRKDGCRRQNYIFHATEELSKSEYCLLGIIVIMEVSVFFQIKNWKYLLTILVLYFKETFPYQLHTKCCTKQHEDAIFHIHRCRPDTWQMAVQGSEKLHNEQSAREAGCIPIKLYSKSSFIKIK